MGAAQDQERHRRAQGGASCGASSAAHSIRVPLASPVQLRAQQPARHRRLAGRCFASSSPDPSLSPSPGSSCCSCAVSLLAVGPGSHPAGASWQEGLPGPCSCRPRSAEACRL